MFSIMLVEEHASRKIHNLSRNLQVSYYHNIFSWLREQILWQKFPILFKLLSACMIGADYSPKWIHSDINDLYIISKNVIYVE